MAAAACMELYPLGRELPMSASIKNKMDFYLWYQQFTFVMCISLHLCLYKQGRLQMGWCIVALFWNITVCILSALYLQLTVFVGVFQHVFIFMDGCFPGKFVSTCFSHRLCGSCHLCELKLQNQL